MVRGEGGGGRGNSQSPGGTRLEDLLVWQDARVIVRLVYEATLDGALARDFGLRDQVRRAAVSVMSNIAEGYLVAADHRASSPDSSISPAAQPPKFNPCSWSLTTLATSQLPSSPPSAPRWMLRNAKSLALPTICADTNVLRWPLPPPPFPLPIKSCPSSPSRPPSPKPLPATLR